MDEYGVEGILLLNRNVKFAYNSYLFWHIIYTFWAFLIPFVIFFIYYCI